MKTKTKNIVKHVLGKNMFLELFNTLSPLRKLKMTSYNFVTNLFLFWAPNGVLLVVMGF